MPVVHELLVSAEPSVVSAQATTASPTPSQKTTNTTLPIGVIAGSIAGGVALAAVFVVAWTYWGKAFQRRQRKQAVCGADQSVVVNMLTVIMMISAQSLRQETISVAALHVAGRGLSPYVRKKSCILIAKTQLKASTKRPTRTTIERQK